MEQHGLRRRRVQAGKFLKAACWLAPVIACIIAFSQFSLIERISGKRRSYPSLKVLKSGLKFTVQAEGELLAVRTRSCDAPRIPGYWEMKILWMSPEGQVVNEGDVVCRLDPQDLTRDLRNERYKLETTLKELEKEKAEVRTKLNDMAFEIESARKNYLKQKMSVSDDPTVKPLDLEEARVQLNIAEIRLAHLEEEGEMTRAEGEAKIAYIRSKVAMAERNVAKLEKDIEAFSLKAPWQGTVVYKADWRGDKKKVGESVWSGWPFMAVADLGEMTLLGEIKEEDARRVRKGCPAEVALDTAPDRKFPAEVASVGQFARRKEADKAAKVFELRFTLAETDPDIMRPGMRAKAQITVDAVPDVIAVPIEAVFEQEGRTIVYVKKGSGHKVREVTTGPKSDTHIAILEGLEPNEEIYLERPDLAT